MSIKLIALDIDHTLINSAEQLTSETQKTLITAKNRRIKVVLCSGRPARGVKKLLQELDLNGQDDQYLICLGGSFIQTTNGESLYFKKISAKQIFKLYYLSHLYGLKIQFEGSDSNMYTPERNVSPVTVHFCDRGSLPLCYRTIDEIMALSIAKAVVVGDEDQITSFKKVINTELKFQLNDMEVIASEVNAIEFNAKNVSKGNALDFLGKELDITKDEMMAVGDQSNDLSMLNYVKYSVAMGNAIPEVKQAAHYLTDDNDHDGVAHIVQRLVLNEE